MTDYRSILKRVGLALIAFGLADIGFMIYSVSHGQSYSSSFNIFAVIAGIFLWRGSLGAARLVTWFAAFLLTGFIGAIFLVVPFVLPIDLLIVHAKLNPVFSVVGAFMVLGVFVLLGWAYKLLRSPPVVDALKESGRKAAVPRLAFGAGLALVTFMAVMLSMTLNGDAGIRAVELAREQLGPGYNYTTQSIRWGGGHASATVVAYNESEIKYVPVEWSE